MAAFMEVNSNPQSAGYGTIRVLQLPQDTTIRGPQQVQNDFESNATVASALTLLRQDGSRVTQGNLITLPVGGGLLYFEPVYVSQAADGQLRGLSHAAGHARVLQRPGRVRSPRWRRRWPRCSARRPPRPAPGTSPPSTGRSAPASATVLKYLQQAETYYSAGAGGPAQRRSRQPTAVTWP